MTCALSDADGVCVCVWMPCAIQAIQPASKPMSHLQITKCAKPYVQNSKAATVGRGQATIIIATHGLTASGGYTVYYICSSQARCLHKRPPSLTNGIHLIDPACLASRLRCGTHSCALLRGLRACRPAKTGKDVDRISGYKGTTPPVPPPAPPPPPPPAPPPIKNKRVAVPTPEQLEWLDYEVGAMLGFNLQTLCTFCTCPHPPRACVILNARNRPYLYKRHLEFRVVAVNVVFACLPPPPLKCRYFKRKRFTTSVNTSHPTCLLSMCLQHSLSLSKKIYLPTKINTYAVACAAEDLHSDRFWNALYCFLSLLLFYTYFLAFQRHWRRLTSKCNAPALPSMCWATVSL